MRGKDNQSLEERFWEKVQRSDGCWLWAGAHNQWGYGRIVDVLGARKLVSAHRVSWEIHRGKIPVGLHVLHRCDNPPCVNPDHLFIGTARDNKADEVRKKRHNFGSRNGMAVLTDTLVSELRRRCAAGEQQLKLAREYGLSPSGLNAVILGRSWRHLPILSHRARGRVIQPPA